MIHEHVEQQPGPGEQDWPPYHLGDDENGNIVCYADDTTFTTSDYDAASLSSKLSEKYRIIAQFMVNNRLKLNDDKTHLLVMCTGQTKGRAMLGHQVQIVTPTAVIKPSRTEKLLGCWVQDDLKWGEHLRDSTENLIRSLNTRLGALKKIRKIASFKNRKMIAEGIFMSKLSYLILLWGGCGTIQFAAG